MALPGMKSTADFVTDERPKNWRAGLLLLSPRNNAPLFSLTAAMQDQSTDDPEFYWWEEGVQLYNYTLNADLTDSGTTLTLVEGGLKLKPGDMLKAATTGEAMRVATVVSDTSITVQRAVGPGGTPAGTGAALDATPNTNASAKLLYIGSAYREGAPRSRGTSFSPSKKSNLTQIFRDPVEWTRTAAATEYRTGDPKKNDRRRAMHKHALGIERALWMGTKYETLEDGQPIRFTGGVLDFIPAANQVTTGGAVDMDELESYMARIFAYGASEKLAFGSIGTMIALGQIVRKNTQYQWGPREKEWGIDVRRFHTPAGTLVLTEHPLFGQAGQFLANDLVIMDTNNLKYRYLRGADTHKRENIQTPGDDGTAEEWLTECGLEVHHGETFFWLKGITSGKTDD